MNFECKTIKCVATPLTQIYCMLFWYNQSVCTSTRLCEIVHIFHRKKREVEEEEESQQYIQKCDKSFMHVS